MRNFTITLLVLVFITFQALGQEATENSAMPTNAPPRGIEEEAEKPWSVSLSVYTYIVPDDVDYAQPTVAANFGRLHVEARYNYEALETGSLWLGYNLSGGKKLTWEFTPMLGGVVGETTGIAPGYKGSLSWWKFTLYSEGEYFIDPSDSSEGFFYNWSELTLSPLDWFRFGMVTQRTRVYETDREVQRGILVGFTLKKLDLAVYLLNPDESKPTGVVAVAFSF